MGNTSSISRRIESCILATGQKKYEDALIHYFPALDKTAKRRRPNAGVGERIRLFLQESEDVITAISLRNIITNTKIDGIGLPEALYKFGRNSIAHEGELGSRLRIVDDGRLLYGKEWQLPSSFIIGLTMSVVVAPENSQERLGKQISVRFLDTTFDVDDLWGQEAMVRRLIAEKFGLPRNERPG